MPVQHRVHAQILRAACGLLRPNHIGEVRDHDLHLTHAKTTSVNRKLGVAAGSVGLVAGAGLVWESVSADG
jgi:hypothetical protein